MRRRSFLLSLVLSLLFTSLALAQVTVISVGTQGPAGATGPIVNVKSYGAVGDGVADDTSPVQAALNAAVSAHEGIYFPAGTYRVTQTLLMTRPVGITIEGAGGFASRIQWDGTVGNSVLKLYNARKVLVRDLGVVGSLVAGKKPLAAIEVQGDSTDGSLVYAPTECTFHDLWIDGGGTYGIAYTLKAGSNDQNNDMASLDRVSIANFDTGFYNQHANGKVHSIRSSSFLYGVYGIYLHDGSAQIHDNYFGSHSEANIRVDGNTDALTVQGNCSETSKRFFYFPNNLGTYTLPIVLIGNRIVQGSSYFNQDVVAVDYPGPLTVIGNLFSNTVPVAWSSLVTYALNDYTTSAGVQYKSLQANNLNHLTSDPAWWVAANRPAPGILLGPGNAGASTILIENNYWAMVGSLEQSPGKAPLDGTSHSTATTVVVTGAGYHHLTVRGNVYRNLAGTDIVGADGIFLHTGISLYVSYAMNDWLILSKRTGGGGQLITLPTHAPAGWRVTIKDAAGEWGRPGGYSTTVLTDSGWTIDGVSTKKLDTSLGSATFLSDGSTWWVSGAGDGNARTLAAVSADRGDADQTLTVGTDEPIQRWATALTGNRTVTLSTTGAVSGDSFRVVRTGLGAFTLNVGGLKTISSGTAAFVDVIFNGSAWVLSGYGPL